VITFRSLIKATYELTSRRLKFIEWSRLTKFSVKNWERTPDNKKKAKKNWIHQQLNKFHGSIEAESVRSEEWIMEKTFVFIAHFLINNRWSLCSLPNCCFIHNFNAIDTQSFTKFCGGGKIAKQRGYLIVRFLSEPCWTWNFIRST
jgi:hypothetical protein